MSRAGIMGDCRKDASLNLASPLTRHAGTRVPPPLPAISKPGILLLGNSEETHGKQVLTWKLCKVLKCCGMFLERHYVGGMSTCLGARHLLMDGRPTLGVFQLRSHQAMGELSPPEHGSVIAKVVFFFY